MHAGVCYEFDEEQSGIPMCAGCEKMTCVETSKSVSLTPPPRVSMHAVSGINTQHMDRCV